MELRMNVCGLASIVLRNHSPYSVFFNNSIQSKRPLATQNCMQDFLNPYFDQLDEELAMGGVPIHKRPFDAAWKFARRYVLEVRIHNGPSHAPGNLADYAKEEWFQILHTHVNAWYRNRYGSLLESGRYSIFRGITLYACTPFEMEIPRTTVRQGKPGETIWLGFPASVGEAEDAEKWVVALPNTDTYSPEALTLARTETHFVANTLRFISSRLTGAAFTDDSARSLIAGVQIHLEAATGLILSEGNEGSYSRAQWELQMAVESSFKGLLQQRKGTFPHKHCLSLLFDMTRSYCPSIDRNLIATLPNWREAASLRYGLGDAPTSYGIFESYKVALALIANALEGLEGIKLDGAEFEIRKAPWLG